MLLIIFAMFCLPLLLWGGGMLLFTALPHVVFWLLTIGLLGVVAAIVKAKSKA